MTSVIETKHLYKAYQDDRWVIEDVNLDVKPGEFVVLLGPSGCGKTTLLKMINKLIPLSKGYIYYHDKDIGHWDTVSLRRSIGYVIQHVGLFPHMTIEKNIAYVPEIMGMEADRTHERVLTLLDMVGLGPAYLRKYPRELSGGQSQRVGVARALAASPDVILMDEPFGATDEITRRKLQQEMKEIHARLKKTIVFVTHDIEEAMTLGTRIVLMKDGKIIQDGTPESLVFSPKNDYVRDFFGMKGFKATMDEEKLKTLYADILADKRSKNDLFD